MKIFFKTLLMAGLACLLAAPGAIAFKQGEAAPDFQGKTIEGKDFTLSDYKGKPILLKLGTTWCPSCRMQTKDIDDLTDFLKENNIPFVDVFLQDSESSVQKYFDKGGFNAPTATIIDDGSAMKAYNVYLIPRVVLIDKDFNIVRDGDTISAKSLKKKILQMVKQ